MVPWAFLRHGGVEIENKETAIAGRVQRGEMLPKSPLVGSTPSGVFIITIHSNTILIPLL
jgi:hypothetical protein